MALAVKGSCVPLIKFPEEQKISIGSLKTAHFRRGYYAYVGSAMGGINSRLNYHLKQKPSLEIKPRLKSLHTRYLT